MARRVPVPSPLPANPQPLARGGLERGAGGNDYLTSRLGAVAPDELAYRATHLAISSLPSPPAGVAANHPVSLVGGRGGGDAPPEPVPGGCSPAHASRARGEGLAGVCPVRVSPGVAPPWTGRGPGIAVPSPGTTAV